MLILKFNDDDSNNICTKSITTITIILSHRVRDFGDSASSDDEDLSDELGVWRN
jgi:hypothetical protein